MSIDAMKQALETLEGVVSAHNYEGGTPVKAITVLRQAIEQAEQDPIGDAQAKLIAEQAQLVAWSDQSEPDSRYAFSWSGTGRQHSHIQPLYTAPPQRQPLTLRQIEACIHDANGDPIIACRNVEAAHGIKGEA